MTDVKKKKTVTINLDSSVRISCLCLIKEKEKVLFVAHLWPFVFIYDLIFKSSCTERQRGGKETLIMAGERDKTETV